MQIKKRHRSEKGWTLFCLRKNELKGACKVDDFIPKQRISFALHVLHPRAGLHGLCCAPACTACYPVVLIPSLALKKLHRLHAAAKRAFLLVGLCERPEHANRW